MKLILANGIELTPIVVTGGPKHFQNATRDTLNFVFADCSVDEMGAIFTEVNCETIKIIGDDGSEALHSGYVICTDCARRPVEIQKETGDTPAVYENRVFVSMSQRSYIEKQNASLIETVDILVMESLLA